MSEEPTLTLEITLEHEDGIVRAQRWLKGFITIHVHGEDIHVDDNSNTLDIELIGKEITREPKSGDECESGIFHDKSSRRVMQGVLQANCEYRFPFSLYAPGSVAPSMELFADFEGEKVVICCIEYILTASIHSISTYRRIEMVGQPLNVKLHPVTVEPSVVPVVTKSFPYKKMTTTTHRHRVQSYDEESRHHGCLIWAAHVKNTHVGKEGDTVFSFSLRNCCAYDVVRLSAKIVEKVAWKTEAITKCLTNELVYTRMHNLAFSKHQKATLSRRQSQIVAIDSEVEQEMSIELTLQENTVVMQIPSQCRDSYKGKLIQVTHHLLIEATTGDTQGKDHAVMTMELPLKVFDGCLEGHHHHLHHHEFDFRNPKDKAVDLMAKWPKDSEDDFSPVMRKWPKGSELELQVSFSSVDEESWDSSEDALIQEEL